MATRSLSESHQAQQEALVSLIPALLKEAWPLFDPAAINDSFPRFAAVVKAIVAKYGAASAAGALDYYSAARSAAGVVGRPAVLRMAPTAPDRLIENGLRWAVSDLYGPVTDQSVAVAQRSVESVVTQIVLDQSRDTIIDNSLTDRAAKGWARVTEQGACSFCIMLALRAGAGFLYTSSRSAGFLAHVKQPNGSGGDCQCHAEPVFTSYEPSHRMRELNRVWSESTKGRTGHDARVAFRQAVEGRDVTGSTHDGPGNKPPMFDGSMSKTQLEHQIALTEGLKDSPWRTKQLVRLRAAAKSVK